jgi:hypothetical protein
MSKSYSSLLDASAKLKAGLDYKDLVINGAQKAEVASAVDIRDQTKTTAGEGVLFSSPDVSVEDTGNGTAAIGKRYPNAVVISNVVASTDSFRGTEVRETAVEVSTSNNGVIKGALIKISQEIIQYVISNFIMK